MLKPLLPVLGSELNVPTLGGNSIRHVNLDGAASAPALVGVADRVMEALPWSASVHRGAGYASQISTALYERARTTIGDWVGARTGDVTILTRNTTDATNLLASAVPGGIVVLDHEHHANLLPWRRASCGHVTVRSEATVTETLAAVKHAVVRHRPALLAISGASNVTGEALPLDQIVAIARTHGVRVFVDAAQLIAHRRFSLSESGVDYVAFSGHKLYAPFGSGALVGRCDWLDAAPPYLDGGGAVERVTTTDVSWTTAPARHEGGTPNLPGAIALAASIEILGGLSRGAWENHERRLIRRLTQGLADRPGVEIARLWTDSDESIGVVTFRVRDTESALLAAFLSAEHGISVRDGRFCAHPLFDRLGWADGVRASIGVGTRASDVDRLLDGVDAWLSGETQGLYVKTDGQWAVVDDVPRPAPLGLSELLTTTACTA